MNLTAESKLKFDRRMQGRAGWISDQELQSELDDLPDVAEKIATEEDEPAVPASAEAPAEAAPGADTLAPPPAAEPAGGFGAPSAGFGERAPAPPSPLTGFGVPGDRGDTNE